MLPDLLTLSNSRVPMWPVEMKVVQGNLAYWLSTFHKSQISRTIFAESILSLVYFYYSALLYGHEHTNGENLTYSHGDFLM